MSTVNEKMTALADEVRELSGTTGKLGIDAMTSSVGEANADVISQIDLISQIRDVVDNLPEAGSGGITGNILFGTYTFSASMDYPGTEFELTFSEDEVFAYFKDEETLLSVTKLTVTNEKIELTPFNTAIPARFYDFTATGSAWQTLDSFYGDGWERPIFFRAPITTTDIVYQSFISLLDTAGDPYRIGYDLGYNVGYSDGEASGAGSGLLEEAGYSPMFVRDEFGLILNGGFNPVIPSRVGYVSILYSGGPANLDGAHYYVVEWVDYDLGEFRVIEEVFPILTTTEASGQVIVMGFLPFGYEAPMYGLLITSTEHEVEG